MENTDPTTPTLVIVNGGMDISVKFLDGKEELIKVRQLPLRLMPAYGAAQGDEGKLCELFTDKDTAWVDSLETESQEQIVETGDSINIDFFARWAGRRMKANEKLKPIMPALVSLTSAS